MSSLVVIEVELLSGRYHAHPWGEAQFGMAGPEWPPSPWRLLRALASASFGARPTSEVERDRLLETLGRSGPVELWLPRTSFHENRIYQPMRADGPRALHHDHFAVPEDGTFWFAFHVDLAAEHRALVADLLRRIVYFGRAESRARLRVADLVSPPRGVYRVTERDTSGANDDAFRRVLCTSSDFNARDLWSVRSGSDDTSSESAGDGHPAHLVDALLARKMPLPSGTRWREYAVPQRSLVREIRPRPQSPNPPADVAVSELRFRLNRRIAIPLRLLVAIARSYRDATVDAYQRMSPDTWSSVLTGRDPDGRVAHGDAHAYYLPRRRTNQQTIDELVVRVPTGRLARAELDALLAVERIQVGPAYPVTIVNEEVIPSVAPVMSAVRWRSTTPFVPPLHHRKGRQLTSVEEQAAVCLERLYGWRPITVQRTTAATGDATVTSLLAHDYTHGQAGSGPCFTRRLGFWLELVFDEPVALYAPLGADAHFGAGQFAPVLTDA